MIEGMRVCWPERGRATLESFTLPEPKPGEAIVQTEVTLISPGTERAFFLGLPNAPTNYPHYPGYCNIGRVVALGEGTAGNLKVGDRVASHGSHASHVRAGVDYCAKVPEGLSPAEAAFCNLVGISMQGVRKARVELGESVLVLGQGLIGNLALQLARLQGAFPALGFDPDDGRRQTALECGADACFDPTAEATAAALSDATDGLGPAVVIEATGSPEVVNNAFALARENGRVVLLASTRGVT
jgi:2-desacetyl-2-hydroxyethyl bacteriochlorophyllide A dehydrogenase